MSAGYDNALRKYVLSQLPDGAVITDIAVTWDDGDRYDPTYGGSTQETPSFRVRVEYHTPSLNIYDPARARIDGAQDVNFEMTFTSLLRAVLGVDQ